MDCKNGLYLTSADFVSYQDDMSEKIESYEKLQGVSPIVTYEGTKDPDLRNKNITFVVTEACNLDCTYCYETHKTGKSMTKEVAKKAIDFLFDDELVNGYYDSQFSNSVILDIIGGEPLLNIEVVDYITEYFKYKAFKMNHPWATNYMVSISTNGTLYFDEKVQEYIKRNRDNLSFGITIDGNKELHDKCRLFHNGEGSYDIVESAVLDYVKTSSSPQTKITLSPDNVSYLTEAIKNVGSLGIKGAYTNFVFEEGWSIDNAKTLYSEMIKLADYLLDNEKYTDLYCSLFDETIGKPLVETRNWCGGNGSMLAISPDGTCFPCIRFMQYSLNKSKEQPIGNIYDGLESKECNPWLCALKDIDMVTQCQHEDNKKCLTCDVATGCSLCTGYNYDYYGDPNHKATFICDMHRARVLANTYFWNKLYRQLGINKSFKLNLDKKTALKIIDDEEFDLLINLSDEVVYD